MLLEIRKIGNSAGITIPKNMLKNAHLSIGDKVEAKNIDNGILLETLKVKKSIILKICYCFVMTKICS